MNPILTWVADHVAVVLLGGLLFAAAMLVTGALATRRTAKRLRTPARSPVRFALSLVLLAAGAGALLLFGGGLLEMGPGIRFHSEMLGRPAPELKFVLVESNRAGSLADYRGRVVLVNVWATWCPPCIDEMPDLDRLQSTYAAEGLVVLHLSDETRDTLLAWLEGRSPSTLHAYARPLPWPESGRPTTYLLDREGTVRRVLLGQRTYGQLEGVIRPYL